MRGAASVTILGVEAKLDAQGRAKFGDGSVTGGPDGLLQDL
jgi:hypothetical protein